MAALGVDGEIKKNPERMVANLMLTDCRRGCGTWKELGEIAAFGVDGEEGDN